MSRVNFGVKPWLYPMPVLIVATYDENGVPDAMNAAWGIITDMNEISISMGEHKTTENIAKTGAFTVSMATADTVTASDYVGIESAAKECKVKCFDNGILVGEIVNINADESVLTDGRIDPAKLKPISYDPVNNDYLVLGEKVGNALKDGLKLK